MSFSFLLSQPMGGPDREEIEMIRKWKLIEYLDLEEEQAEHFFPRLRTFEKQLESIHTQKREQFAKLDAMLEEDNIKSSKVDDIIETLYDLDKELQSLKYKHYKNCDDILTLDQKAKYLTFERKFKRQMKNKIRGHKGRKDRPRHRF